MKQLIISITLMLIGLVAVAQVNPNNFYAIMAGTNNDGSNPQLSHPQRNVSEINNFFRNYRNGVIPASHLHKLTGSAATTNRVLSEIENVCASAGWNDVIFIYLDGHGSENAVYLSNSYISFYELNNAIKDTEAKLVVIVINACHSGIYDPPDNLDFAMIASAHDLGYDDGMFTRTLVNGLTGNADANFDYCITVAELFNYINRHLSSQTPVLKAGNYNINNCFFSLK